MDQGTVLSLQGTNDCTLFLVQRKGGRSRCVLQRKSPQTLARPVGTVFGKPKLTRSSCLQGINVKKSFYDFVSGKRLNNKKVILLLNGVSDVVTWLGQHREG